MTLREAIAQAQIELGRSKEDIEQAARYADEQYPLGGQISKQEIPKENERVLIDFFKKRHAYYAKHPEKLEEDLASSKESILKKNLNN